MKQGFINIAMVSGQTGAHIMRLQGLCFWRTERITTLWQTLRLPSMDKDTYGGSCCIYRSAALLSLNVPSGMPSLESLA